MFSEEIKKGILSECLFKTSRSGGAGGQHVNKVSSRITIDFNIENSNFFTLTEKDLLLKKLGSQLSSEGYLQVNCDEDRSQAANKEKAIIKLFTLLKKALHIPKRRKATKPTKSSKLKNRVSKEKKSEIKTNRQSSKRIRPE